LAVIEALRYGDSSLSDMLMTPEEIQNALAAITYSNALEGHVNMSFVSVDDANRIDGFILAYVGVFGQDLPWRPGFPMPDEPVVFIHDFTTAQPNTVAASRLLRSFLHAYVTDSASREKPLPIFAQMRETTSYPHLDLFRKRLSTAVERLAGLRIEAQELGRDEEAEGRRVHVLFTPTESARKK
jgi:hypothetical protein